MRKKTSKNWMDADISGCLCASQSRENPLNLYNFFEKAVFCSFAYYVNHIFINVLFILYIYINKTLLSRHSVIVPKKLRGVRV